MTVVVSVVKHRLAVAWPTKGGERYSRPQAVGRSLTSAVVNGSSLPTKETPVPP